ncbi:MAG: DUF805 domain-containing protein [Afipia sp.]|nr:DUF805 domain-containing protein [Afipia sp.]
MDFGQAVNSGFKNFVGFDGRASRSEYWFWTLFSMIATLVAGVMDGFVGFGIFSGVVSLVLFLPGLAVAFRRFHDLDHTAWWLLLTLTGVGAVIILIWFCFRGTAGPNRFGPDPL